MDRTHDFQTVFNVIKSLLKLEIAKFKQDKNAIPKIRLIGVRTSSFEPVQKAGQKARSNSLKQRHSSEPSGSHRNIADFLSKKSATKRKREETVEIDLCQATDSDSGSDVPVPDRRLKESKKDLVPDCEQARLPPSIAKPDGSDQTSPKSPALTKQMAQDFERWEKERLRVVEIFQRKKNVWKTK